MIRITFEIPDDLPDELRVFQQNTEDTIMDMIADSPLRQIATHWSISKSPSRLFPREFPRYRPVEATDDAS